MTRPTPDEICEMKACPFCGSSDMQVAVHLLTEAADLIQQQQATIERLSAALERAIEAIQEERDCMVECATAPPEHDLSTLDPLTKHHVEEYDAMLADLRIALGKDANR